MSMIRSVSQNSTPEISIIKVTFIHLFLIFEHLFWGQHHSQGPYIPE